jgi:hypothetical protein
MRFPTLSEQAFRLDLSALRVTEDEILADLLYPAGRIRPTARRSPRHFAHSARRRRRR